MCYENDWVERKERNAEPGNERKDSITEKDLNTAQIDARKSALILGKRNAFGQKRTEEAAQINQRKDRLINAKRNDFRQKRTEAAAQINTRKAVILGRKRDAYDLQSAQEDKEGEINHEHSADGSTGAAALEGDKSGNLPADGRGQGAHGVQRSSSQADNEGNQDLDAGGLDGSGSVAGKSSPIHLQDSGTDREVISTGSGRERESDSSPSIEDNNDSTPASEPRTQKLTGTYTFTCNSGSPRWRRFVSPSIRVCSRTVGVPLRPLPSLSIRWELPRCTVCLPNFCPSSSATW